MKLSLQGIDRGGVVSLAADGTITAADFHTDQKNPFEAALGASWATMRVALNLGSIAFIDSSAIGWLIEANKSFKAGGGQLVMHSIQPKVRQIFDLLRLGKALSLAETDAAAKELLAAGK